MDNHDPQTRAGLKGGKGKVTDVTTSFDADFWAGTGPQARMEAIFELRRIYYEVLHPGTGSTRLDRTVGGTRRRTD